MLCTIQACENVTIIDDTPPHPDNTGTGTFTVKAGDYGFLLEKHGLIAYINLRHPLEEELEHFPIMNITYKD